MKPICKFLLLCTALVLLAYSPVLAQPRAISEGEFTAVKDAAYQKLRGGFYRSTLNSKNFRLLGDKIPYYERTEVMEKAGASYHHVLKITNEKGVQRSEFLESEGKMFVRKNDEPWKLVDNSGDDESGDGVLSSSPLKEDKTIEQSYLGKEKLKGRQADVYWRKITRKYDANIGTSISEEKFWVDEKGRFLRIETNSRLGDKNLTTMTAEFDYDPNIKIKTPKIR